MVFGKGTMNGIPNQMKIPREQHGFKFQTSMFVKRCLIVLEKVTLNGNPNRIFYMPAWG